MNFRKALGAVVFSFTSLALAASSSEGKGILEILRDKGVITEEEYRQAIEEAKGNHEKVVQEAKAEAKKETKAPDWLNRISLFGDLRYRHEGFYNSELAANNQTRNRERIRARFGLGVNISEELEGKVRIVTGDAGDPISTNQTLSELFTRKPINLDWAYIKVSPWKSFGLDKFLGSEKPPFEATAGKFAVPMFAPGNSELVFDADLSPEGVNEALTLWDQPKGFFRNLKLTAIQWSIKEIGNSSAPSLFRSGDGWMFGGQAQVQIAPTADSKLTLAFADYGFQNLGFLAREKNSNSFLQLTNNVRRFNGAIAGGAPVSTSGCASPFTGPTCIEGFLGGFNVINFGAQLDVPTPWKQWPLGFFLDYAHNTLAETSADNGYWLGVKIGQIANKGDLRFTYSWARTETDAVPSMFNYSDMGRNGGTNVTGHIISLDYVLLPRLVLTAKNHFVNWVDRPVGFHNPTQFRLQLDAVLSF